jgi:hypothetical protein
MAVSDRGIAWLAGLALSRLSTNGSESFANADRLPTRMSKTAPDVNRTGFVNCAVWTDGDASRD